MGTDSEFRARIVKPITDAEFNAIAERFRAEFDPTGDGWPAISVQHEDVDDTDLLALAVVRVDMLERYFGPDGTVGHWPTIRAVGDWVEAALGDRAELRYGNDYEDLSAGEPWQRVRDENDRLWASLHG